MKSFETDSGDQKTLENQAQLPADLGQLAYYFATELRHIKPMAHGEKIRQIEKRIEQYFSPLEGAKCLDLGCGTGVFSRTLAELGGHVIALDSSKEGISFAKYCFPDIDFRVGSVDNLNRDFPAGFFDHVLCASVFEHLIDHEGALLGLKHVLKAGGRLIISTDLVGGPWETRKLLRKIVQKARPLSSEGRAFNRILSAKKPLTELFGESSTPHVNLLGHEGFRSVIENAGFEILEHDVFTFYRNSVIDLPLKLFPKYWRGDYQCIVAKNIE